MPKATNKRRPKAEVIRELDEQLERGQSLRDREIADAMGLAIASVERLTWRGEVLKLLPQMSKGIQAAADFNRTANLDVFTSGESLDEELAYFRKVMDGQLDVLRKAVDRWRKSGTRPLT